MTIKEYTDPFTSSKIESIKTGHLPPCADKSLLCGLLLSGNSTIPHLALFFFFFYSLSNMYCTPTLTAGSFANSP